MGGCVSAGNVSTIRTPLSAIASVEYTMPNGASPRDTSASAARTFSARATCFSTLGHTPSFSSAALAVLAGRNAVGIGHRELVRAQRRGEAEPGAILSVDLLDAGAISTSALRKRSTRVPGASSPCLSDVVHPVEVGRDEDVGRRARLDLLRERVARAVRNHRPCCRSPASKCRACSSSASLRLAAANTSTSRGRARAPVAAGEHEHEESLSDHAFYPSPREVRNIPENITGPRRGAGAPSTTMTPQSREGSVRLG